jgi:3-oxoacyl-[acyl-carrier protein] reductase
VFDANEKVKVCFRWIIYLGDQLRLENKVVIITGGGSGIGRETALLFSREGAKVIVADLCTEAGEKVAAELNELGEGFYFKVDVCDRADLKQLVAKVLETYGRIDVLINNAGIVRDALVTGMSEEQWNEVINANLTGVFNCVSVVAEIMIAQKKGVIINASSIVGLYGNVGQVNYAAAKAGIVGLTKALAKELGRKGVRVNAVAPGFITTRMTESVPDKILGLMKERTPLGRLGLAKDVAYAYLYLASDESSFVNGAILSVDGGLTI